MCHCWVLVCLACADVQALCCLFCWQFIRTVTEIRGEWLLDLAPHYYDMRNFPQSGAKRALEKIVARRRNT